MITTNNHLLTEKIKKLRDHGAAITDFMEVACGKGKIIINNIEYLGERIIPKKFFSSTRNRLN